MNKLVKFPVKTTGLFLHCRDCDLNDPASEDISVYLTPGKLTIFCESATHGRERKEVVSFSVDSEEILGLGCGSADHTFNS